MTMKNFPFLEDFGSMGKKLPFQESPGLGEFKYVLGFTSTASLCAQEAINDTLVTKKANDRNRQKRGF